MTDLTESKQDQLGLSAHKTAKLLGISLAHFWKLHASGQTPRSRRLGRRLICSQSHEIVMHDFAKQAMEASND